MSGREAVRLDDPLSGCAVTVRLYGPLTDLAGTRELAVTLPAGSQVGDIWPPLIAHAPATAALRTQCALAVNGRWADGSETMAADAVIDVIPPVSGG